MEHRVLEFSAFSPLGIHVLERERQRQRQRERLYVVRKEIEGQGGSLEKGRQTVRGGRDTKGEQWERWTIENKSSDCTYRHHIQLITLYANSKREGGEREKEGRKEKRGFMHGLFF